MNTPHSPSTPSTLPPVATIKQVADYLQVSERTVRRLTVEGSMPCSRVGRGIRYTTDNIKEYLRRCKDDGSSRAA